MADQWLGRISSANGSANFPGRPRYCWYNIASIVAGNTLIGRRPEIRSVPYPHPSLTSNIHSKLNRLGIMPNTCHSRAVIIQGYYVIGACAAKRCSHLFILFILHPQNPFKISLRKFEAFNGIVRV